jgi:anti-sigma factor RsiW
MNCLECQDWLQRRLDGESIHDEKALEQHLAACPSCREQHAAAAQLLHAVRHWPRPAPAPDLSHRLATAVLRDRQLRRGRMQRRLYITAGLAAAVLLMLLVSYSLPPRTPSPANLPEQQQPVAQNEQTPAPTPPGADSPGSPKELDESKSALASLTDRLTDKTREHVLALWSATNPLEGVPTEELPAVGDLGAAQPLQVAGQEVTQGVQTVTRSARQALAYFARELPALEPTAPH